MKNNFTIQGFGQNVFDDKKMRKYLPAATYKALTLAREYGVEPEQKHIEIYARALKKWAIKRGITRYTHWFQPLNNFTAEKRDSLYSLNKNGQAIFKFGSKQLQRGEGDASSLPSGGMRDSYEARGVTKWDYASYPFIKGDCLRIPTTFCGASGETLDKKTPLLKSNAALNKQAKRLLAALGISVKNVKSVVGAEQEYFLVDKDLFDKRKDLVYTGRTLFGKMAPKGQEFDDHYFRPPSNKVIRFMQEADAELWKLGIIAKTEHNEVAPRQYELAPCYTESNVACDQNQLICETLKNVAEKHGFACLLHEKPFDKINGSGKHNNWSVIADSRYNLLEVGNTPEQNAVFVVMLSAVVKAADEYNALIASSIATADNDLRLGGYEAPPRILTVFLGEPLTDAIKYITDGDWQFGKDLLPQSIYAVDRNRTSPLAYTGNKFEFRMVGSSAAIADVNAIINVAVAESLRTFADKLEKAENKWQTIKELVKETFANNRRVIYNGNGYSKKWLAEAEKRGLSTPSAADLISELTNDKTVDLFARHDILTERELQALQDVKLKRYCDTIRLESVVSCEIYERQIAPIIEDYSKTVAQIAANKQTLHLPYDAETDKLIKLDGLQRACEDDVKTLKTMLDAIDDMHLLDKARAYGKDVRKVMASLRCNVNKLEQICPKNKWPMPTYGQILFGEK